MNIKDLLLQAPDSQLDNSMKELIKKWSEPVSALEVLEVLDKSAYFSLASDFTMQVLHLSLNEALGREQTSLQELTSKATWRGELK